MTCEKIKGMLPDYLTGRLDPEKRKPIGEHLSECAACQSAFERMNGAWQELDRLPEEEPSAALRSRFYAMLPAEKARAKEKVSLAKRMESWVAAWWPKRPAIQFALSVALLIVGLVLGSRFQWGTQRNGEMAQLRDEVRDMRQMVSMSLLKQPLSIDRLRGVSFSTRVEEPDESLLSALLATLNEDPNVNVRLAAVDALFLFADHQIVRDALIASLSKQTSPLVQIALIDLLAQIRETQSLEALKELIQDQKINPTVKQHAETRIEELT
ncbi:MAG: HEAT repeat domain-containing protein [bacterium]